MFRTFNMGIGLIAVCAANDVDRVVGAFADAGEPGAARIGLVLSGNRSVSYV
jgi:phosphoribosylaminoimidazole (AIR) synthetase